MHRLAPQPGCFQHVRLVDGNHVLAALAGGVKRGAGNALDFHDAVPLGVVSLRAILPLAAATLAKVNATGQFAHHHQVKALCHDV